VRTLVLIVSVLLIGLFAFSLAAVADPISFPIILDPSVSNGWIVASYVHACGGCVPDLGDEETYLGGGTTSQVGVLNLASLASGPGGGAFADLTHGALGIDSVGFPNGAGEVVEASLIVNVSLTGSGVNTVHFNVAGSSAVDACLNLSCTNTFGSYLSIYSVGGGVQESTSGGGCEGSAGCAGITFPNDLSLTFDTTSQTNIYQFQFNLLGVSNGFAGIFAANTGLISFDLAPGVTMDTSSGFLTQPGDPNLGGTPSAVPEPASAPLLGGVGLIALYLFRRKRCGTLPRRG
jgi:PEP-CTERM motif-containing protein